MKNVADPQYADSFGNLAIKGISEVALPDSVSYFPQTSGWKIVGLAIFLWAVYKSYQATKQWWHNRYRRDALKKVEALLHQNTQAEVLGIDVLAELSVVLKATALQVYPRRQIAELSGAAWLQFLNQHAGYTAFDQSAMNLLSTFVYQKPSQVDEKALEHLAGQITTWIKQHPKQKLDSVLAADAGVRS